jgi:hypothetical protein
MPISGYDLTLVGATLGDLVGIKSINVGGVEVDFDEVKTVEDVNRIVSNIPMAVRHKPMEAVFVYSKALKATLVAAAEAQTKDTLTLTDVESSTHVGAGYVKTADGPNLDTDGHAILNASFQPETRWAFTAGT